MAKNENVTVSPAAAQACGRAVDLLRPYENEPRIATLMRKLGAIASPANFQTDQLAETMADVAELRKGELDPFTSEQVRKSQRDLEAEYLRTYSPAAYAQWETEARRAGLA